MTSFRFLSVAAVGAALFAVPAVPALGQDATTGDPAVTTETTTVAPVRKFDDTALLTDTMMADEKAELEAVQAALDAATAELKAAQDELAKVEADNATALQAIKDAKDDVDAAQLKFDTASQDLATAEAQLAALIAQRTATVDPVLEGQIAAKQGEIATLTTAKTTADTNLQTALATQTQVKADNAGAVQALADAQGAVDGAKGKVDSAQSAYDSAKGDVDAEKAKVEELIAKLSPEQLFALNRSLNNATKNPFGVDIDSEHLQMVLDGDYDRRQINALTKALESEAKFRYLAEKTGNDRFLEKAEREKAKFMANIERFDGSKLAKGQALRAAREDAEQTVKGQAGREAKAAAAQAAKEAAKGAARAAAKQAAKDAIKQSIKDQRKAAARGGRNS